MSCGKQVLPLEDQIPESLVGLEHTAPKSFLRNTENNLSEVITRCYIGSPHPCYSELKSRSHVLFPGSIPPRVCFWRSTRQCFFLSRPTYQFLVDIKDRSETSLEFINCETLLHAHPHSPLLAHTAVHEFTSTRLSDNRPRN